MKTIPCHYVKMMLCFYLCLIFVITTGKQLTKTGHVGHNLTFDCPLWDVWTNFGSNVKYFCESPCKDQKHNIIKAATGQNKTWNRTFIQNKGDKGLTVTFTNLQKSDAKLYHCGLERTGLDSYTDVELIVTDNVTSVRSTTVGFASISSPVQTTGFAQTVNFTSVTNMSMTYSTFFQNPESTADNGSLPYVITGVIVALLIIILMVLGWKMRKHLSSVTNQESQQPSVEPVAEYDTVDEELTNHDFEIFYASVNFSSLDPDSLYVNYVHQRSNSDPIADQNTRNQEIQPENDSAYSLLQQPSA